MKKTYWVAIFVAIIANNAWGLELKFYPGDQLFLNEAEAPASNL